MSSDLHLHRLAVLVLAISSAVAASRPPPNKLLAVKTNCTRDVFNVKMDLAKPFRGVIFAKDFLDECRTNGNQTATVVMSMATAGCGIRSEHRDDGTYELSVQLVMQMDGKLRQMSDIKTVVRCILPAKMMSIDVDVGDGDGGGAVRGAKASRVSKSSSARGDGGRLRGGKQRMVAASATSGLRNGRMNHYDVQAAAATTEDDQQFYQDDDVYPGSSDENADADATGSEDRHGDNDDNDDDDEAEQAAARTPRVRVWMELGGPGGADAVEVGELTTFAVRAVLPGNIGVRVVDCAALDGIGETSQKLLDDRGCPVDEQVMPALFTRLRPMEDGWSKPHVDDLVEKLFTATFAAFKFPDRERLHLSCGVQLCRGACPDVDCATEAPFVLGVDGHLARIEVFNSLTVTAPKIDLDRMRALNNGGGGGNGLTAAAAGGLGLANVTTADEYPPRLRVRAHADGILCMSTSRLALAFCVLGLIFLVAVVVAVYCLLRARTRRYGGAGSGFGMAGCGRGSSGAGGGGGSGLVGRGLHGGRLHLRTTTTTTTGSTSIFSSSSGSQSRFGSKLIIAPGGSLPYGRVY